MADNGAPLPNTYPTQAAKLAGLIARDRNIRLAFVALGGWDTHVRQGAHNGQLADRLRPLGDGLAAFAHALGSDWADTVVIVISEFGRTVRENGDGGTDHGHGNAIWVAGGRVLEFPSLAETAPRHVLRVAVVSCAGKVSFGLCADADPVPARWRGEQPRPRIGVHGRRAPSPAGGPGAPPA